MRELLRVSIISLGLLFIAGCYNLSVLAPQDGGADTSAVCDPGWAGPECDICVRFVAGGVSEGADYLSWATGGLDINAAIQLARGAVNAATADVCEVWVAEGTYYFYEANAEDTVQLAPGVRLYGGFSGAGTENERGERDFVNNLTVLSGHAATEVAQVYHVVTGADDALIDGFVIEGGFADGSGLDGFGGGMLNASCSPQVHNCVFQNNFAEVGGGGMFNQYADPEVVNCRFHGNVTDWVGGGVVNDYSSPFFENCTFSANVADMGGGGMDSWSDDQDYPSEPTLQHCSFGSNASGFSADGYFNVVLRNCAFQGDFPFEVNLVEDNSVELHHCVLPGGSGETVIDADPVFTDPEGGDLTINSNSPCVDAADANYSPPTDIEGNSRFDDPYTDNTGAGDPDFVDIGAYELQQS